MRAFAGRVDVLVCSLHGRAELIAAAHRKVRESSATAAHVDALLAQVAADQAAGALDWLPITAAHLDRVTEVFRRAPSTVYLRAAEALHLASAAEAGFTEIYSNDLWPSKALNQLGCGGHRLGERGQALALLKAAQLPNGGGREPNLFGQVTGGLAPRTPARPAAANHLIKAFCDLRGGDLLLIGIIDFGVGEGGKCGQLRQSLRVEGLGNLFSEGGFSCGHGRLFFPGGWLGARR